ncbi:MAG: hypothetical protein HEEMFOPI_00630 [Holosporales bacterium]
MAFFLKKLGIVFLSFVLLISVSIITLQIPSVQKTFLEYTLKKIKDTNNVTIQVEDFCLQYPLNITAKSAHIELPDKTKIDVFGLRLLIEVKKILRFCFCISTLDADLVKFSPSIGPKSSSSEVSLKSVISSSILMLKQTFIDQITLSKLQVSDLPYTFYVDYKNTYNGHIFTVKNEQGMDALKITLANKGRSINGSLFYDHSNNLIFKKQIDEVLEGFLKKDTFLTSIDGTFCIDCKDDIHFSSNAHIHFKDDALSISAVYKGDHLNLNFKDDSKEPLLKGLQSIDLASTIKGDDLDFDNCVVSFKRGSISVKGTLKNIFHYLKDSSKAFDFDLALDAQSDVLKNWIQGNKLTAGVKGQVQEGDCVLDVDLPKNAGLASNLQLLLNDNPTFNFSKQGEKFAINAHFLKDTSVLIEGNTLLLNGKINLKKTGAKSFFESSSIAILKNKDKNFAVKGDITPIGENVIRFDCVLNLEEVILDGNIFLNIKDMAPLTTPFNFATVGRIKGFLKFNRFSLFTGDGLLDVDLHSKFFRSPLFKSELTTLRGTISSQNKTRFSIQMADLAIGKGFFAEQSLLSIESEADIYRFVLKSHAHKKGYRSADVDVDVECTYNPLDQTVDLKRFLFNHIKQKVELDKPLHIKVAPFKMSDVNMHINKGILSLKGVESPLCENDSWKGSIKIEAISLEFLSWFFPKTMIIGNVNGAIKLLGSGITPDFDIELKGQKIQWLQFQGLTSKTTQSVHFDLKASTLDGVARWFLRLDGDKIVHFTSEGQIPVDVFSKKDLKGNLKGHIDLSLISALIGTGDRLSGPIHLNLDLGGTLDKPSWKGNITTQNSYVELAEFGTVINNINGRIDAEGNRFIVREITGNDKPLIIKGNSQHSGTVMLKGGIVFESLMEPFVDLDLSVNDFLLVNSDSIQGVGTGHLKVKGEGVFSTVKGEVDIKNLSVNIDTLETDDHIPSIKLKDPKKRTYAKEYQKEKGLIFSKPILPLDLVLKSNGQVFVYGSIITNSQWKGDIHVKGPIHDPYLVGDIHLVKGMLDFFGKNLKLNKGTVTFIDGEDSDPWFVIEASRKVGDVSVVLKIDNKQDPPFSFDSSPSMSRDEILSWLLFGKSAGAVSVGQSLQLSLALAKLKGNDIFSAVDTLKKGFGIDTFDIRDQSNSDTQSLDQAPNQVIHLGKKISENIEITVEQGTAQGTGKFGVEMDVGKNVFVSLDVAGSSSNANTTNASNTPSTNNSGVSITWDKRY